MQRRAARPRGNWAEREAFAKKYGEESVRKLAAILESSEDAIISMTPEGAITDWNGAAQRLYEYSREEAIGRHILTLYPKELWPKIASELELLNQDQRLRAIEISHTRKSGETLSLAVTLSPMNNKEGNVVGISSFAREMSTSGKREELSAPWDRRFRQFAENSNDVFWMYDPQTDRTLYVSPAFREVWGQSCEDLIRSGDSHLDAVHPDDRSRLLSLTENQIKGEPTDEEYRVVRPDGSVAWVRDRTFTIKDGSGKASLIAGIASDITHRKQLEEQLLRSQKMEAVGRLAGGIAHDFNNLLTAILGYSQLALSRLREDDPMFKYVEEIRKAGHRASQLTSHLLAFSRKQVLQPKVLDLNSVISDIQKLLRRLIGEDIDLRVKLDPNLGFVKVDRGQIDQVIMNLVVNARDAMPQGGDIVISTANVELDAGYASG
ncbi:MAG: PAS domain-containing sensor histidine kinase, partial [Blastocatellia bacterium]